MLTAPISKDEQDYITHIIMKRLRKSGYNTKSTRPIRIRNKRVGNTDIFDYILPAMKKLGERRPFVISLSESFFLSYYTISYILNQQGETDYVRRVYEFTPESKMIDEWYLRPV